MKNGSWVTLWTAAAAVSANGTPVVARGSGPAATSTSVTEAKIVPLMDTLRVVLTVTGAGDGNEFDTYAELHLSGL